MLIGDAFYYLYAGGCIRSTREMDRDTPDRDWKLDPDEIVVWICKNGPRETRVYAGASVRRVYATDSAILAALP